MISVVTPALNASSTIQRTLRSVHEQGYERVEHIVVDGGSTDGTVELLRSAPGVRWVSEADSGLSNAVNKGIAMASGDIVGWLNADDLYLPGALGLVGRAFHEHPGHEWLTGPCLIVDGEDREIRRPITAYKNLLLRRYSLRSLLVQNFVSAPSTFVRAGALREVGGLDEELRLAMDYDLWLRLGHRSEPIVLRDPLAAFRMVPGTLSMEQFDRQFAEHAAIGARHGKAHRSRASLNRIASHAIVAVYGAIRHVQRRQVDRR